MRRYMGSKIKVHRVERGKVNCGCDPRGAQIFYKEDYNVPGEQNYNYLSTLLQAHGFIIADGDRSFGYAVALSLCRATKTTTK